VVRGICRERVQAMKKEWSRRKYAWGKTDIVPSISSSCSSFDREPLYRNVMKKWCSYSVREAHTLYSNDKCRSIWKFVLLKIKFTDGIFNFTKIMLYLFERTSEQTFFRPSASQSPQHYSSAIPDNTPGFICSDKRRRLCNRPIKARLDKRWLLAV
jgi:hypothetical protein